MIQHETLYPTSSTGSLETQSYGSPRSVCSFNVQSDTDDEQTMGKIKYITFDFDQTITIKNLSKDFPVECKFKQPS